MNSLIEASEKLGDERINLKPLDKGRNAASQLFECGYLNLFFASLFDSRTMPEMDMIREMKVYNEKMTAVDTVEKGVAILKEGTEALIDAIERFPSRHLEETIVLPRTGELTFAELILQPLWNMSYHEGQINYILTLTE